MLLSVTALANRKSDIGRKQPCVLQRDIRIEEAVSPGKLRSGAIRYADFPDLFPMAHRRPFELTEIDNLARIDGNVGSREFTEHAVGQGAKRVLAGVALRYCKTPVGAAALHPELVMPGIGLPGDPGLASAGHADPLGRMSEPHKDSAGKLLHPGIVQHEPSRHRAPSSGAGIPEVDCLDSG